LAFSGGLVAPERLFRLRDIAAGRFRG
jgi:hypothetical protein